MWKPKEIIVHRKVASDPVTYHVIRSCPNVPVQYVTSGNSKTITSVSRLLNKPGQTMLDKIIAGKKILFIAPASSNSVDVFTMPDNRMMCPHFDRLKLASNGCFYQCDWCYLKLTYRAAFPFITIRAEYDKTKKYINKRLNCSSKPIMFNSGEMADSLALEHLTKAGREFIPWFAKTVSGYLFMLTKSDNVDDILDLNHHNHTIIAWSMNADVISKQFEIGAPPFNRRLMAAKKVQSAGYPIRIRIDPILPFTGWRQAYYETVRKIFNEISPESVTLGTLRFEEGFYKMRKTLFQLEENISEFLEDMKPMFPPQIMSNSKRPKIGKYSFSEKIRTEIFKYLIDEIRKYSNCKIALCKESSLVWRNVGLDLSECNCACQLGSVSLV